MKIMTLDEIAAMTRLSVPTLRWLRHCGTGPHTFVLGRRVVAKESDVVAWINQRAEAAPDRKSA